MRGSSMRLCGSTGLQRCHIDTAVLSYILLVGNNPICSTFTVELGDQGGNLACARWLVLHGPTGCTDVSRIVQNRRQVARNVRKATCVSTLSVGCITGAEVGGRRHKDPLLPALCLWVQ